MSDVHIFEIFGYVEVFLIKNLIKEANIFLCFGYLLIQKSDFCKKWLIFWIFTSYEIFSLSSRFNPHSNQNHRLSIQNFHIQLHAPQKLAKKSFLQNLAEFQDFHNSLSIHPTKSVKPSFEPESSTFYSKFSYLASCTTKNWLKSHVCKIWLNFRIFIIH